MAPTKTFKFSTLILFVTLISCREKISILENRNFNQGDWLLVNSDGNQRTLFVIENEKVLQENPDGIIVKFAESDHYTTCDGSLKLFKDGKLVAKQMYLDPSCITESSAIKNAYKKSIEDCIYPNDNEDFKKQWDSLRLTQNCYPTIYHTEPENKDIILYYKFD